MLASCFLRWQQFEEFKILKPKDVFPSSSPKSPISSVNISSFCCHDAVFWGRDFVPKEWSAEESAGVSETAGLLKEPP